MKNQNPSWLIESHPNFKRWQQARELSIERGKFVHSVVNQKINTKDLCVLDLGSGEGGTSKVFSENNFVVSFDLTLIKLQQQHNSIITNDPDNNRDTEKSSVKNNSRFLSEFIPSFKGFEMTSSNTQNYLTRVNGTGLQLPFTNRSFDLIIIQDVIEHITGINDFILEIKRVLKTDGTIYLSTPNKYSIFNFLSDPHFGLPFVSILKRELIKNYFLKYFRRDDYNRTDIAQLFSLFELLNLFQKDFEISLFTKFSVQELFNDNKGIVWSKFHLKLISLCKSIKLDWVLNKIANDNFGVLNKYFTPTLYLILKKIRPITFL